MKSSILRLACVILALLCAPTRLWAQANQSQPPGQISFQGYLTDANGVPLATNTPQNFNVQFNIYSGPTGGTPLWGEAQVVTVSQGYFTVLLGIGGAIPSSGTFHTNDLTYLFNTNSAQSRYVGLTVQGVSSGELAPRLQMLSAPFALLAANSVNANNAAFATNAANAVHANNADNAAVAVVATNALNLDPNFKIQPSNFAASIGLWNSSGANIYYNNGNVGLGTANALFPLTLANTLGEKIGFYASSTSADYGIGIQPSLLQIHADLIGSDIAFGYGTSTNMTETMRLKGNGNVGIGTNAPATKLDVNGNTTVRGTLTYVGSGTTLNVVGDAEEKVRMVRGSLSSVIGLANGTAASGPGWTAVVYNGSAWIVTFTRAFNGAPTIVASFVQNSNGYWGNNTVSGEVVSKPTATGMILRADSAGSDSTGGNVNLGVNFIAVGN